MFGRLSVLSAVKCARQNSSARAACCEKPCHSPNGLHNQHCAIHRITAHNMRSVQPTPYSALELKKDEGSNGVTKAMFVWHLLKPEFAEQSSGCLARSQSWIIYF